MSKWKPINKGSDIVRTRNRQALVTISPKATHIYFTEALIESVLPLPTHVMLYFDEGRIGLRFNRAINVGPRDNNFKLSHNTKSKTISVSSLALHKMVASYVAGRSTKERTYEPKVDLAESSSGEFFYFSLNEPIKRIRS